jgi:cytochrome b
MTSEVIWPWWVRLSHWLVATGIFLLWILAYAYYQTDVIHRWLGYSILSLVLLRLLLGCLTRVNSARLTIPSWQALALHLAHLKSRQVPVSHGHNPLGQLAVYVIWGQIALLGLTGWISQTDIYWGEDWPVDMHEWLSFALMAIVLLHLLGVVVMSILQKQNLAKSMLTGRVSNKPPTSKNEAV